MFTSEIKFVQNTDQAIAVLHSAGVWLVESGKSPSKWWLPENLNRDFLLEHSEPEEFFVGLVNEKPAVAAIFQLNERNQSWESVDKGQTQRALYVHWLAVDPNFSGKGLPRLMLEFASQYSQRLNLSLIRLDTNTQEPKLRKIYEDLGFDLMAIKDQTAFYQKKVQF
jgi:GNAT superfamily N-acetyltransferase